MPIDQLHQDLQQSLGTAYTLERELGGGGMARVFVAREEQLGRDVVVKVLSPDLLEGLSAERFAREIKLAAQLQEPHIVPVLTAGTTSGGLPYYTMPFVRGESLRAHMRDQGLPLPEAISILRDIAKALSYAHAAGVVHRDIKPENVLLSSGTAVVTDFGIAKAMSASRTPAPGGTLTQIGTSLGTPAYMAPEQAVGDDVDARADVYAWGVIAYELLTNRHPFAGKTTAQQFIAAHIAEVPPALSAANRSVPASVAALVTQCLAKEREARPDSADELLRRLDGSPAAAGSPAGGTTVYITASPPMRSRTRGVLLIAGMSGIAALLAGGAYAWQHRTAEPRPPTASAELAPQRVVVATFVNRTSDPSLDPLGAMAADWIARALAGTGLVDVAGTQSDLAARDTAGASVASQSVASLATLATLAKAGLVISGSYYRRGDSVVFEADFTDASAGKRLPTIEPVAALASRPLDAVELLRQRVTGSLAALLDPRLAALSAVATRPPSMEAYSEYLKGDELRFSDAGDAALAHYARAAALDSAYVLPLLRLMNLYTNLQRDREADSIGRVLQRRQDRLSPFERLYLDLQIARAHYDIPAEYTAAVAMARGAPKSQFAANSLALAAHRAGRLREADSIYSSLDPEAGELRGQADYCVFYVVTLHSLGAHDRVLGDGARACRQFTGRGFAALPGIFGLAALGREKELRVLIEDVLRLPLGRSFSTPDRLAVIAVHELRAHGHAKAAERLAARVVAWHDSSRSDVGVHRPIARARALYAAHAWERLQSLADTLVKRQPRDIEALTLAALARTMRGDRAGAARTLAAIERAPPPVRRSSILGARAVIAAAAGDSAGAVALLIEVSPPAGWRSDLYHFFGAPIYELLHGYAPFEALLRPVP